MRLFKFHRKPRPKGFFRDAPEPYEVLITYPGGETFRITIPGRRISGVAGAWHVKGLRPKGLNVQVFEERKAVETRWPEQ